MKNILEKIKKIEFTRLEYVFLIIAIIWGVFQVFMMPPYQVPDESGHFYRAWNFTNLNLFCDKDLKVNIPKNVVALHEKFNDATVDSGIFSFSQIKENLKDEIDSEKTKVFTQFCSYNPIGHMPQSLGISVAKIAHLSPLYTFYFGRISNLLVSILLVFFAIKITPFGKIIFFFSALLPMSFHQMASLSDDALVISGAFFFSALLFYFSTKKYLNKLNLLSIFAASLLLSQIKPGYIGLLALLLILKPSQFKDESLNKNKASYFKYAGFVIGVLTINLLLFFSLTKLSNPDKYLHPDYKVSPNEQILYIIKNPLNYASVIGEELEKNSENYLKGMTARLGMLSIEFSELFYLFMILAFFIFLSGSREKVLLNFFQRIVIFTAFSSIILSIFTLEYIFWTPPQCSSIRGIQGRYFIAAFPLLIFSIYKIKFNKYSRTAALIAIFAIISILTLRNIHSHYYKYYFTEKPQSENISQNLLFLIEEEDKKCIEKESDKQYIIKCPNMSFALNTESLKGISFKILPASNIRLNYFLEGDKEFKKEMSEDIKTASLITINFDLLEKKYAKKIKKIKFKNLDKLESFSITDINIYQ